MAGNAIREDRVISGCEHDGPTGSDWEGWLALYGPRFLLFARQQSRCEADAQDLVQEAVVASWRQCLDGSIPLPAVVYATIRRRAIDKARRDDRRANRETAANLDRAEAWFDCDVENRERGQLLQEAMKRLPEIYRDVVTLKIWGDLTFAEIALALDIPANTAASRYRYGLIELRKRTKEIFP
jgi:RNA polymerase sigma-70 factor (ECF subfamily)